MLNPIVKTESMEKSLHYTQSPGKRQILHLQYILFLRTHHHVNQGISVLVFTSSTGFLTIIQEALYSGD